MNYPKQSSVSGSGDRNPSTHGGNAENDNEADPPLTRIPGQFQQHEKMLLKRIQSLQKELKAKNFKIGELEIGLGMVHDTAASNDTPYSNRILENSQNAACSVRSFNHNFTSRIFELERELEQTKMAADAVEKEKQNLANRISELEGDREIKSKQSIGNVWGDSTDELSTNPQESKEREKQLKSTISALETNLEESKKQEHYLKEQVTALETNLEWNLETFTKTEINLNKRIAELEELCKGKNDVDNNDGSLLVLDTLTPINDLFEVKKQMEKTKVQKEKLEEYLSLVIQESNKREKNLQQIINSLEVTTQTSTDREEALQLRVFDLETQLEEQKEVDFQRLDDLENAWVVAIKKETEKQDNLKAKVSELEGTIATKEENFQRRVADLETELTHLDNLDKAWVVAMEKETEQRQALERKLANTPILSKDPTHKVSKKNEADSAREIDRNSRKGSLMTKGKPKKYSKAYFEDRIKTLRSEIVAAVPNPDELIDGIRGSVYRPLLRSLEAANQTLASCKAAQAALQNEQKKHPDDDGWKDTSLVDPIKQTAEEAQGAANNLEEAATDACCAILNDSGLLDDEGCGGPSQGSLRAIEHALLECTVLVQATPNKLADWCAVSPEVHGSLLDVFLQDNGSVPSSSLMARFLEAGGPSHGNYGRALEIYDKLVTEEGNVPPISTSIQSGTFSEEIDSLRHRLALAVALEFATPISIFKQDKTFVDPIERFRYYAKFAPSLEDGDDALDKCFATLSVWELRKVVDSNATHEDLTWGREFLRNYRPDQIYTKDSKWRYVYSVRTDVGYRHPDHDFSTYQELLSAGGECGPRAFFGRFICKAWGNPTWGVRQPGHAAMTRWTDDGSGWKVCLGADWKFSWWDDDRYGSQGSRQGPDFLEETRARTAAGSPAGYYDKVVLLECLAESLGETVEADFLEAKVWRSLALAQRKKLAREVSSGLSGSSDCTNATSLSETVSTDTFGSGDGFSPSHQTIGQAIAMIHSKSIIPKLRLEYASAGTIIIPAASFVKPDKPSKSVMVLNSYGGGNQLHLEANGQVEYQLPDKTGTFSLSFRLVNVHRDQKPLQIEVLEDQEPMTDDDSFELVPLQPRKQSQELEVPYTKGYWKETGGIQLELLGGGRLVLSRSVPCWGLSIKDIILRPL